MDGYYDPWPLVILERPVAVSGFFGAEDGKVAWSAAARLGLNLVHIPRLVEHQAGAKEADIIHKEGYAGWYRRCRAVLQATARQRPAGVWTLGPNVLLDPVCAGVVRDETVHVHLRQSAPGRAARVASLLDDRPSRFLPWLAPAMLLTDQFQAMWRERHEAYAKASHHLDCDDLHHSKVAEALMELMHQG